jgi:hypothetical protein
MGAATPWRRAEPAARAFQQNARQRHAPPLLRLEQPTAIVPWTTSQCLGQPSHRAGLGWVIPSPAHRCPASLPWVVEGKALVWPWRKDSRLCSGHRSCSTAFRGGPWKRENSVLADSVLAIAYASDGYRETDGLGRWQSRQRHSHCWASPVLCEPAADPSHGGNSADHGLPRRLQRRLTPQLCNRRCLSDLAEGRRTGSGVHRRRHARIPAAFHERAQQNIRERNFHRKSDMRRSSTRWTRSPAGLVRLSYTVRWDTTLDNHRSLDQGVTNDGRQRSW